MIEPIFLKLGMYIMEPKSISMAYFINFPISQCVCMCIHLIVARQRLGKNLPAAKNTCNNRRIVGGVVFYTVPVVSRESLCVHLLLLGNGSLNTCQRQRRFVVGVVFYAVRVVSKKSKRLVLPRTSCVMYDASGAEGTFERQVKYSPSYGM
jgi:hypothetical protein